uniref:Variant surface glycoprotein 1125.1144 n=1 Tax=Trypanosoma brucei TaxID=5691 RepID=A0A1J0R6C0_9TRYP|nr:variant surface glycoprotein 1125.1144 [Trypanosoma brucei]
MTGNTNLTHGINSFAAKIYILTAAAAFSTKIADATHTTKRPFVATDFTEICTLSGQLKATGKYVRAKIKAQNDYAKQLTNLKIKVAAFHTTAQDKAKARLGAALAIVIEDQLTAAMSKLKDMVDTGINLASQAALAAGHIDGFMQTLGGTTKATPGSNACVIDSDVAQGSAHWRGLSQGLKGCSGSETDKTDTTTTNSAAEPSFAEVKKAGSATDAGTYSEANCQLTAHHATNTMTGAAYPNSNTLLTAGGVIKIAANDIQFQPLTQLATQSEGREVFKEAESRLATFKQQQPDQADKLEEHIYTKALEHEAIKAAVDYNTKGYRRKWEDIANDEQITDKIKAALGSSLEQFKDPFLAGIEKAIVKPPQEWEVNLADNKLSALAETSVLAKILLWQAAADQNRSKKVCVDQPEEATTVTEKDTTCQKKGTGDNCKNGCKVEGEGTEKKCAKDPEYELNREEEEKNTGKRNTT